MFLKQKKCKICYREGTTIFNLKFNDKKILNFFNKEYDKKISNFLNKKIGRENFILKKCNDCEFIWQENIPKEKFLKQIYDHVIDPKESFKKSKSITAIQKKNFDSEITFIKNFCKKKNLNILDFGAGWGSWLLVIKNKYSNIFAIELSSSRKKFLKRKKIKLINLDKTNAYKNFFHVVRLEQVLEHVVNLDKIILDLKKLVKRGGIISIGVPDGKREIKYKMIDIRKGPVQPLEHLNCFSNKSLKLFFKKNGFKTLSLKEIIITFYRMKRFDYHTIRFILVMIKNLLLSTRINFVKK